MRKIILWTALLLSSLVASVAATSLADLQRGPEVQITGRVIDDATGRPIAGATVGVEGTRETTVTSNNGVYSLTLGRTELGPTAGLTVTMVGYTTVTTPFSTAADLVTLEVRMIAGILTTAGPQPPASPQNARSRNEAAAADLSGPAFQSMVGVGAAGVVGSVSSTAHTRGFGGGNREQYAHIAENDFRSPGDAPLSTFSIDVDRASYSNIRRFLRDGQLPPVDAVRIEEMVNYFSYTPAAPSRQHPFSVTTEVSEAPWRDGHLLMRIGLSSPTSVPEELPASNLVFLIDVSGSMQSPDKLPLVKQSLRLLVDELRPRDRLSMVVYAGAAGVVLPPTSGSEKTRIREAIESLEAGGSTAGGAGLRLAYDLARQSRIERGNNRVILASDGDFNVGVSSDSEMIRLVEQRRSEGTFLTVLGFGTGNLQDAKMEQMADHGNGNYAYIDSLLEARKTLVAEMGGTLLTVASDVKLQVEFNPAHVRAYRLIGYENRLLAAEDFNDDTKDAGELGAGHSVTALYEVVPMGVDSEVEVGGVDPLRYQQPERLASSTPLSPELAFIRVRYKRPGTDSSILLEQPASSRPTPASVDQQFASAVAGFGMLLRDSPHKGLVSVDGILSLARSGRGADREGYRADFISLVERYAALARAEPRPRVGEGDLRR